MAIPIKSPRDLEGMRRAGALLWRILDQTIERAVAGVTTAELDRFVAELIAASGAEVPGGIGLWPVHDAERHPSRRSSVAIDETKAREVPHRRDAYATAGPCFPGACSISINEEAIHAIPGPRILRAGDMVTIDIALRLGGWCADVARAVAVGGEGTDESTRLVAAARGAVEAAIAAVAPGRRWSDVVRETARIARGMNVTLVPDMAGHGIGRDLHEPPACPFGFESGGHGTPGGQDFVLRPGMALTIEPVLALGGPATVGLDDGWTVVMADRSAAAHEERTIAVTRHGAVVLTAP